MFHTMIYRLAFSSLISFADIKSVYRYSFISIMKYQRELQAEEYSEKWLIRTVINFSKNCTYS